MLTKNQRRKHARTIEKKIGTNKGRNEEPKKETIGAPRKETKTKRQWKKERKKGGRRREMGCNSKLLRR